MASYRRRVLAIILMLPCLVVAQGQEQQPKGTMVTLNLAQYVDLALTQSFTALQYLQQKHSQSLALNAVEAKFLPQFSFNTEVAKERKNTYSTTYQDHYQEGINGGMSLAWALPTGASFNASYQHEYGRAIGLDSIGVNSDYQSAEVTSAELLQPLLQTHPIDQQQLPIQAARLQWRRYEVQGELLRLEGLRDALLAAVDYQVIEDKVNLHRQAVDYSRYRLAVAQDLYQAGRLTQRDVTSAKIDSHQRHAALIRAQGEQAQLLGRISAQLDVGYGVSIHPVKDIPYLMHCLVQGQSPALGIEAHPQVEAARMQASQLQKQYQFTRYDLWPTVDLFYRYKGTHSSSVKDSIERSVGVEFSYSPVQRQAEADQALSRSTWLDARYDLDAKQKTLVNESKQRQQQQIQIEQQLDLAADLVALARRAYQQELQRFEEGVASSVSVRDAQNQLQESQMALLDDQSNWLQNRLHWNFVQSRNIDLDMCSTVINDS